MEGKIVVLEGIDGSGKQTQVMAVEEILKRESLKCVSYSFPDYTSFFGKEVRKYLSGEYGSLENVHPKFASLLYALDRFKVSDEIKEEVAKGSIVLLDRYTTSNMAHQGSRAGKDRKSIMDVIAWVMDMEYKTLKIPTPDLCILLDVPADISKDKIKERGGREGKDLHEDSDLHLGGARRVYLMMAEMWKWPIIPCWDGDRMRDKKAITRDIMSCINKFFPEYFR